MELSEVRKNIDRVDGEIRRLFMERMSLADQVACIKAKTEDVIYKPDREEAIIRKQTEGMDTRLVREYTALIKRIMEVSRKYQYGRTMELRDCFPFSYEKKADTAGKLCMVKEELYLCMDRSKDDVLLADTYEEMGEMVRSGRADGNSAACARRSLRPRKRPQAFALRACAEQGIKNPPAMRSGLHCGLSFP